MINGIFSSILLMTAKTRRLRKIIQGFVFICSIFKRSMSDIRQAGDRVASQYCQRWDHFSANGIVSSGIQNMAEMFGGIRNDLWNALVQDQTINTPLLTIAYYYGNYTTGIHCRQANRWFHNIVHNCLQKMQLFLVQFAKLKHLHSFSVSNLRTKH